MESLDPIRGVGLRGGSPSPLGFHGPSLTPSWPSLVRRTLSLWPPQDVQAIQSGPLGCFFVPSLAPSSSSTWQPDPPPTTESQNHNFKNKSNVYDGRLLVRMGPRQIPLYPCPLWGPARVLPKISPKSTFGDPHRSTTVDFCILIISCLRALFVQTLAARGSSNFQNNNLKTIKQLVSRLFARKGHPSRAPW